MKIPPATRLCAAAASLVAPLLLAGCDGDDTSGSGPRIVTSFYALQYVAERVAGEHASVVSLTSPGQEPHDLELSLRATADLDDADLVVYEHGFQSAVDEAVETADPEHVVDAAEHAELRAPGESEDEHHEAHDHDEEFDPHLWLSPANMVGIGRAVLDELVAIDPDHEADYRASFEAFRADLEQLAGAYAQGLADCRLKTVVVSHDAFAYLPGGLRFVSINGLSPHAEPSPAHVAELRALIEREHITTVFSEELASAAMAETLADDLGLDAAVLDPIEGLSDETAEEDYLSLMEKNLAALRKANGCR